jgi:hypothetical protein
VVTNTILLLLEKSVTLPTVGRNKLTTVSRSYILVVKLFMAIVFLSAKCGQALRLLQFINWIKEFNAFSGINRPVILMIHFGSRMTSGVFFVGNIIFWFFDKILSFIENYLPT